MLVAKRKLIRNHRVPKIVPNELKKLKNNLDALDLQAMVKKEEETYQSYILYTTNEKNID